VDPDKESLLCNVKLEKAAGCGCAFLLGHLMAAPLSPHLLIEAAPLLESLYVHASHGEDEPSKTVPGEASPSRHRHLKELVVIGFHMRRCSSTW
jgi:hypothetical protein